MAAGIHVNILLMVQSHTPFVAADIFSHASSLRYQKRTQNSIQSIYTPSPRAIFRGLANFFFGIDTMRLCIAFFSLWADMLQPWKIDGQQMEGVLLMSDLSTARD